MPAQERLRAGDAQYDFVHASFDEAQGGNVPRIPLHHVGLGIYYCDANWFARRGFPRVRPELDRRQRDADGWLPAAEADLAYKLQALCAGGMFPR